jgi:hypothetical protein
MKNKVKFAEAVKKIVGVDGWKALTKAAFETEEVIEEEKEEMAEATLSDGTIITYDKLEEGGQVMVIAESGPVVAPDGMLELTDGTMVDVVGGIITAVSRKEVEMSEAGGTAEGEVEPVQETTAIDMAAIEKMMEDGLEALYKRIMKEKMAEEEVEEKVEEEVKEEMAAMRKGFAAMVEVIENIMENQPTSVSAPIAPETFGRKETKQVKFQKVQNTIAEVRNAMIERNKSGAFSNKKTKA